MSYSFYNFHRDTICLINWIKLRLKLHHLIPQNDQCSIWHTYISTLTLKPPCLSNYTISWQGHLFSSRININVNINYTTNSWWFTYYKQVWLVNTQTFWWAHLIQQNQLKLPQRFHFLRSMKIYREKTGQLFSWKRFTFILLICIIVDGWMRMDDSTNDGLYRSISKGLLIILNPGNYVSSQTVKVVTIIMIWTLKIIKSG